MNRRGRILLAVCCIAAPIALALFASSAREPRYSNRPLSFWLVAYQTNWGASGIIAKYEATDAVRQIGTNAFPCLLDWIRYKDPAWKGNLYMRMLTLSRKQHRPWILKLAKPFIPCSPNRKDTMALTGFEILGLTAEPALPELVKLAYNANDTNTARRAIWCLARIGPAAFPCLINAMTNTSNQSWFRACATFSLADLQNQPDPASVSQVLNTAAKDPDIEVRRAAAMSLERIAARDL